MIKSWQGERLHLWKKKDAILFLTASTSEYSIGTTGDRAATTWFETTLDADEAAAQTTLSVTATTGMANSDVIGILLDDNTMHWTTISSFVAGDTVTVASGLASAASSGNKVFGYTSLMQRPLKVLDAQIKSSTNNEIDMFRFSREEYRRLPNKANTGIPTNFYYNPTLTNGTMKIWPTPSTEDRTIRFTAAIPFEDFDATTNDPDFPQEWFECLVLNLAVRLKPVYGTHMSPADWVEVKSEAVRLKEEMSEWDADDSALILEPEAAGRR